MATRGFLIRFIDIGLIVLFGFLMISDIEASSRVELAGSGDVPEEVVEPREETVPVVVEIAADGAFLVGLSASVEDIGTPPDAAASEAAADGGEPSEPAGADSRDAVRVRVTGVAALEDALRTAARANQERGLRTVVVIEPSPASAVQRTVDVMDASDRLGLPKSLRMDIEVVGPDPGPGGGTP